MDSDDPYREAAKVKEPVEGSQLPARPAEELTSFEGEPKERTGPGVRRKRAENEEALRSREEIRKDGRGGASPVADDRGFGGPATRSLAALAARLTAFYAQSHRAAVY